jgi:hypothetical protein
MGIVNPPKALILLVALLCVTLLLALNRISTEAGLPIVSAIVFYGIGNGVQARTGSPSSPIIGPKEKQK